MTQNRRSPGVQTDEGKPPLRDRLAASGLTVVVGAAEAGEKSAGVREDLTPADGHHLRGCDRVREHYCRTCGVLRCACQPCECHRDQGKQAVPCPLTPRERLCLELSADGLSPERIAAQLGIKVGTVHEHLKRARWRLPARTNIQAVAMCMRAGWIL